jgi:hypothetical protein
MLIRFIRMYKFKQIQKVIKAEIKLSDSASLRPRWKRLFSFSEHIASPNAIEAPLAFHSTCDGIQGTIYIFIFVSYEELSQVLICINHIRNCYFYTFGRQHIRWRVH